MTQKDKQKTNRSAGFTLIEVMVVVVIIGVLATLVLPRVVGRQEQAFVQKAKADIRAFSSALQLYKLDNFNYPDTSQGLQALVSAPSGDPPAKNWKQYLDVLPKDPWGNPYQYQAPGENLEFDIWTYGADGQPGGAEGAADVGNWNLHGDAQK